jgi:hypothetical protein
MGRDTETRMQPSLFKSLEKASADHEMLDQYMACYKRIFTRTSAKAVRKATEATRHFLRKKVVEHFAFEERRIFPALLEAFPSEGVADLVLKLRADHKRLMQEARRLDQMLADETAAYNRPSSLRKGMLNFFHRLEKHAAKEDELFPLLT